MHKICLCPASIAWIIRNLKKSSKSKFRSMIGRIPTTKRKGRRKGRKHRTAKQRRATRKLVAFNKRRRR